MKIIGLLAVYCFLLLQPKGDVRFIEDPRTTKLFERYLEENAKKPSIDGFRIQIHFGNEREKAREIKTRFLQQFPGIEAYESYQQPNFRIRIGDFRSRIEALKSLKEINKSFPAAFIVKDRINLPPLEK